MSQLSRSAAAATRAPGSSDPRVGPTRGLLLCASLALPSLLPKVAAACAVCSAGQEDATRMAFIGTTVFLTALPLSAVGGIVWWLCRRTRAHARAAVGEVRGAEAPVGALRA